MIKICFVTATRAEYGLLKWMMYDINKSDIFCLQLIVTGGHLLKEQGYTLSQIEKDGFIPSDIVDVSLDISDKESIAASMGRMSELFAHTLKKLSPNYVAILGDRYELLPICSTAFVMGIPIIHFSGGDVTEGAIDDGIRNAITMLAKYHFPGTQDAYENIKRMRGTADNIWNVGEPGLDSFYREKLMTKNEIAADLALNMDLKWVLLTYHPETNRDLGYNISTIKHVLSALSAVEGIQVIATYANADYGGKQINEQIEKQKKEGNINMVAVPSLGNHRYLSLMRYVSIVIGNSSSGIIETPTLGIPVVNIGDRQKGRHLCSNIVSTKASYEDIRNAIEKALTMKNCEADEYWGNGHTSEKVIDVFSRVLV